MAEPLDPHHIESDRYDRALLARLRGESAALRRLAEAGSQLMPHFDALLEDLFCALFKYNVLWRPEDEVAASAQLARHVLRAVCDGVAHQALRLQTLLDEERAGLATVLIGEALLRAMREDRVLTSGDLTDLWSLQAKEERESEAADELATGEEIAKGQGPASGESTVGDSQDSTGGEDPAEKEGATERAVKALRSAARGAAAERRQKTARVKEALERTDRRLSERLTRAAIDTVGKLDESVSSTTAWGRGLGAGGRRTPGQAIDLGRRLASNPKLGKLAALVGRMRENAMALRRRVLEHADQEVYEIGRSRGLEDIARLVPHELVSLSHPVLRRDFLRRLLDGGAQVYSLRGAAERGRGPLVVCVDTSSSMAGDKEIWAKAVALTFLEIARRQRRRCVVVCFSNAESGLRAFEMNPGATHAVALERALDLAEWFPGGGTDFAVPLDAALTILREKSMRRGDVVFITDGECDVPEEWRERFLRAKAKLDFSLYAILIDMGSVQADSIRLLADRVSMVSELTADTPGLFTEVPRASERRRRARRRAA